MENSLKYLIMEVEKQTKMRIVNINDGVTNYGNEPQSMLWLKEPGRFSLQKLAGTLRGKAALHPFKKGDLVAVSLSFRRVKMNHEYFTRVDIEDIKLVKELDYLLV